LRDIIARCCQLKAEVVADDERETTGRRAILNYGHTFCHAFESCTGYGHFLHGEAVSIGMLCASRLAESLEMIAADITQRQFDLLTKFGLPTAVPAELNRRELVDAMQHDKKTEHGKLHFILPTEMGHVKIVGDIDSKLVEAALN
jgi:3-dehydroquinate synthase